MLLKLLIVQLVDATLNCHALKLMTPYQFLTIPRKGLVSLCHRYQQLTQLSTKKL